MTDREGSVNHSVLPIDGYLPAILEAIDQHPCVIVEAPPGSGKTTRVAPALLSAASSRGAQDPLEVLLIQPRRIAARSAASRIAYELHTPVGGQVGYQVRFDRCLSRDTRLICMTPGILLRRLQSDVLLERVGAVILDEFHERSLEVDLLLGMLRRIQTALRPELKIIVMSATLEAESLSQLLEDPPVIQVDARPFPVDIRYARFQAPRRHGRPLSASRKIVEQAVETTLQAATAQAGDILVFLPGVGEIMQVAQQLQPVADKQRWELFTLFGDMSPQEQDRALQASEHRKVILATNVAETSLTIDGVTTVVDSGWARVARVDASSGLNRLSLEPICQASAQQRAGRAGRTAPGVCYRLWDQATDRGRAAHLEPEIWRIDLSAAALQLIHWGEQDVSGFPWVTAPRPEAWQAAIAQLLCLDAIRRTADGGHELTDLGRALLDLPVHPRIGRFLLAAAQLGVARQGALAAAMLSERDVFDRRQAPTLNTRAAAYARDCDLTEQVLSLEQFQQSGRTETAYGTIKSAAAKNVLRVAKQFLQLLPADEGATRQAAPQPPAAIGSRLQQALLQAFPDRLAKRRAAGSPRGLMVGGRGVKLDARSGVQQADLFLCLDVDDGAGEATVRMASSAQVEWLSEQHLREDDEVFFNPTQAAVVARRRTYWFDLMIAETPVATPADDRTTRLLSSEAAKQFQRLFPAKDKELASWLARVTWLGHAMPELELPSFEAEQLAECLSGWCFGMRSIEEVKSLPWKSLLPSLLDAAQRKALDQHAPESFRLPSGRAVRLTYEIGKPPVLAARIQEFFGLSETPKLAGGRRPLLLHLLAPNNRCQQITDDLASFWANTYPTVRKELRGRYPKHAWPEDPRKTG